MSVIAIVIVAFSTAGAVDYLLGNKFGLGKEFQKAFSMFAPMAMSTLGMLVLAPALGAWLTPVFEGFYNVFGIDPSIIPASLFANDMGGMQLAQSFCKTEAIGNYNAFVIAAMMGCVISFTIPFSLGIVQKKQHKELFFGLICGIITIPVGSFVAGLICRLNPVELLINLLPLLILSVIIGVILIFFAEICIRGFMVFGLFMKILGVIGLSCAIFTFLTGIEISPHMGTFESAAFVCANACVTFSGMLPAMLVIEKLLKKPLGTLGEKLGINTVSALALLGTLVTNASAFGVMDKMDKKGTVLNAAFAVSAAFVFGSHLAFTMAFDSSYIMPMMAGKLISGVCAVLLAHLIYRDKGENCK